MWNYVFIATATTIPIPNSDFNDNLIFTISITFSLAPLTGHCYVDCFRENMLIVSPFQHESIFSISLTFPCIIQHKATVPLRGF